jgi:hypothetical protein
MNKLPMGLIALLLLLAACETNQWKTYVKFPNGAIVTAWTDHMYTVGDTICIEQRDGSENWQNSNSGINTDSTILYNPNTSSAYTRQWRVGIVVSEP